MIATTRGLRRNGVRLAVIVLWLGACSNSASTASDARCDGDDPCTDAPCADDACVDTLRGCDGAPDCANLVVGPCEVALCERYGGPGQCVRRPSPDGTACQTGAKLAGTCTAGVCSASFSPRMAVEPTEVRVRLADLPAGGSTVVELAVTNVGTGPLTLSGVTLDYHAPYEVSEDTPGIGLGAGVPALPVTIGATGSDQNEVQRIALVLTRGDDDLERSASLRLASDDPVEPTVTVPVSTFSAAHAALRLRPKVLDFGFVDPPATGAGEAVVQNVGGADLVIDRVAFAGDPVFTFRAGALTLVADPAASGAQELPEPIVVAANGGSTTLPFTFAPRSDTCADTAELVLYSNDPTAPDGSLLKLRGNIYGECVPIDPLVVDFGGVHGTSSHVSPFVYTNCSIYESIGITDLRVEGDPNHGAGAFDVQVTLSSDVHLYSVPQPVEPYDRLWVEVTYRPGGVADLDESGQPVRDEAMLIIETTDAALDAHVPLSGYRMAEP